MNKACQKNPQKSKMDGTSSDGQDICNICKARYKDERIQRRQRIGTCTLFESTGSMRRAGKNGLIVDSEASPCIGCIELWTYILKYIVHMTKMKFGQCKMN